MSKLFSLLFSTNPTIADLEIRFADGERWPKLRQLSDTSQYAFVKADRSGPRIVVEWLAGPTDRLKFYELLTSGTVIAKGTRDTNAFLSVLLEHKNFEDALRSWIVRSITIDPANDSEIFVIGDTETVATTNFDRLLRYDASVGTTVLERATELIGEREQAEAWYNYQPIPAFENKTPRQLVQEGRSDAILLHLDTLEDGVYA